MKCRKLSKYERVASKIFQILKKTPLPEKELIWMLAEIVESSGRALSKDKNSTINDLLRIHAENKFLSPGQSLIIVADEIRAMVELHYE